MILDIKRKAKEKRIIIVGILLGICVAAVSLFYFFYVEKSEAEKRMVEIVNYVKVQCSTYTHYNESSESKSLLRAIEQPWHPPRGQPLFEAHPRLRHRAG